MAVGVVFCVFNGGWLGLSYNAGLAVGVGVGLHGGDSSSQQVVGESVLGVVEGGGDW